MFCRADTGSRHTIRIFTPRAELPFAGHPTIGTAAVLAFLKLAPPPDEHGLVVYEEQIDPSHYGCLQYRVVV